MVGGYRCPNLRSVDGRRRFVGGWEAFGDSIAAEIIVAAVSMESKRGSV